MRLQKIYFEDTFLSLTNFTDNLRLATKKNRLLTENLFNLATNMVNQKKIDMVDLKSDLLSIFEKTEQAVEIKINITAFKINIFSEIINSKQPNISKLPEWLQIFELNSSRYSYFLQNQISIIKMHLKRLEEPNINDFKKFLLDIFDYIEDTYILVKRHDVLLNSLALITSKFLTADYESIDKIRAVLKDEKIDEKIMAVLKLIDDSYDKLISENEFSDLDINEIPKEVSIKLNERIKCSLQRLDDIYRL